MTSDFKFWDYRSFSDLGIPDNASIFNVHQTDDHFYLSTYSDPYAYFSDSFTQTPLTPLAYSDDAEGDWIIANRSGVLWSPVTQYDYATTLAVVTYLPLIDIMLAVFVWYLWWRSRPTFDYERAYAELIAYFPELPESTHIPIRQSSIVKRPFWSAQIAIGIFLVVLFLGAMYPLISVILPILGVLVIYLQVRNWTAQMVWLGRTISPQERRKYVIYITGLVLMSLLCMCAAIILGSNSSERLFFTLSNLALVALIYFLVLIFALIPNARMNFHKAERNATILYRFFQFMPNIMTHYAQSRYVVSRSEDSIDLLWGIALRHKLYPVSVVCSAVTFLAMDCSQRNYTQAIKLLEFFAGYYPKANYLLYVLAYVYLEAGVYPVRAYDLLDHANMRPLGMAAVGFDLSAIKEMCRAWAMAHMRQHDAAKRKVKEVFEKNPNLSKQTSLSMYATAGKIYALLGDKEEARLYLNKVIEMSAGTLFAEEARKDLGRLDT